MIGRDFARDQIARFAIMPGYRDLAESWPEAIRELIDALQKGAVTQVHAKDAIDQLMGELHKLPVPADIYVALNSKRPEKVSNGLCATCRGIGYKFVEIKGYSYAFPCDCQKQKGDV